MTDTQPEDKDRWGRKSKTPGVRESTEKEEMTALFETMGQEIRAVNMRCNLLYALIDDLRETKEFSSEPVNMNKEKVRDAIFRSLTQVYETLPNTKFSPHVLTDVIMNELIELKFFWALQNLDTKLIPSQMCKCGHELRQHVGNGDACWFWYKEGGASCSCQKFDSFVKTTVSPPSPPDYDNLLCRCGHPRKEHVLQMDRTTRGSCSRSSMDRTDYCSCTLFRPADDPLDFASTRGRRMPR